MFPTVISGADVPGKGKCPVTARLPSTVLLPQSASVTIATLTSLSARLSASSTDSERAPGCQETESGDSRNGEQPAGHLIDAAIVQ